MNLGGSMRPPGPPTTAGMKTNGFVFDMPDAAGMDYGLNRCVPQPAPGLPLVAHTLMPALIGISCWQQQQRGCSLGCGLSRSCAHMHAPPQAHARPHACT